MRPGDNLYSSSVIALDVDTGKIRAYHQYHWNDSWDWDEVSTPLLIDFPKDGRTVKGLVHPGRNGYLWRLESRGAGQHQVRGRAAVRHPGGLHQDRPGDRTPELQRGAQAPRGRHR